MANYNIKLKENELQIIDYISTRADKRKKLQSIYQYVVKYTTLNGGHFIKTNKEFYDMYIKHHYKMKADTFRKFLDLLSKFGLIIKKKYKNVNVFTVNRNIEFNQNIFFEDEIPTNEPTIVPTSNTPQSVDITNFEEHKVSPNTNIKDNYINIIYNTSDDISKDDYKNSLAYKKACEENNKDTLEPNELVMMAKQILKEKKRRSRKILSMVINKLYDKRYIVRANAVKYLEVVVADCIAKYEFNREMYAYAIAKNKNNYRLAYNKSRKTSNFENFTQRQYDYNKLEKQLLGWDNEEFGETTQKNIITLSNDKKLSMSIFEDPKQNVKSKKEIMFEKYLENKNRSNAQGLERQALYMDFCRDLDYGII